MGLGTNAPAYPLQMASGAHVTTGGVWTDASSREYKTDIASLTLGQARETLAGLDPVTFKYKADADELYVGFIAEDVPELVATADRKGLSSMDIVGVLTRVVQEQEKEIVEYTAQIDTQQEQIDNLEARLAALEQAVGTNPTTQPGSIRLSWLLFAGLPLLVVGLVRRKKTGGW